jgi:hypothetical protein
MAAPSAEPANAAVRWFALVHRVISVAVACAVPVAVYFMNGSVEPWAFVLGAVIGFSYWYFFPLFLL